VCSLASVAAAPTERLSAGHQVVGLIDLHPDEQEAYLNLFDVKARLPVDDYWYLVEPLTAELTARRTCSGHVVNRILRDVIRAEAADSWAESDVGMTAHGWRQLPRIVSLERSGQLEPSPSSPRR
jgi:hypothetical protein